MKKLICIFSGMLLSILLVTSVFASGRYEETDRGTVYITDETKQIPYLTFDEIKDKYPKEFQDMIEKALNSKDEDSFKAIRSFGPACGINDGFGGVIHLLIKYDNLKEMIIANSKAGGDTSARAMIATIIFMANHEIGQLPKEWMNINAKI